MIGAMTMFLLLIGVVAAFAVVGTIRAIARDDRGMTPPPASHAVDPAALPPALRLSYRP